MATKKEVIANPAIVECVLWALHPLSDEGPDTVARAVYENEDINDAEGDIYDDPDFDVLHEMVLQGFLLEVLLSNTYLVETLQPGTLAYFTAIEQRLTAR